MADEAHVLPGALRRRLAGRDCYVVGLTATPFGKDMASCFDTVVTAATTRQLIDAGLLCDYRVFSPSIPNMKDVRVEKGEFNVEETERRVLPIVGDVVAEYIRRGEGRKFICFAVSIAHAEELQRQFIRAGVPVDLYTCEQPDAARALTLEKFRKPDSAIRGLISVEALTRGFDVPDVGVLILARPLRKALAIHIQMLGRVLRTAEGKTEALVLDHAGNMVRFWSQVEDFFENGTVELDDGKRKEPGKLEKKEREPRTCPECHHVHDPAPSCPECGLEYPRRLLVTHEAGELSEVNAARAAREEKQAFYSMLVHHARSKGYQPGWAYHKYREKFHVEPRGLRDVPVPPSPEVKNWIKSKQIAFAKRRRAA